MSENPFLQFLKIESILCVYITTSNMTNDKNFASRILLSTVMATAFALMGGLGIGFMWGLHHHNIKNGRLNTTRCNQYTVLNSKHVITACGDTIQYNWKPLWKDVRLTKD